MAEPPLYNEMDSLGKISRPIYIYVYMHIYIYTKCVSVSNNKETRFLSTLIFFPTQLTSGYCSRGIPASVSVSFLGSVSCSVTHLESRMHTSATFVTCEKPFPSVFLTV